MARPAKQGIDYFPYDIDLDQDDKLGMIIGEFGFKGELLFTKLCAWIYKNDGYYVEWCEDVQLRFLRRYDYCGFSVSFIQEVVPRFIKWGLFDKTVFDAFQIITSPRIQRTWFDASRKRKERVIDQNIWLISVSSGVKAEETPKKAEETIQSKVKESKVKESKVVPAPETTYGEVELIYNVEEDLLKNQNQLEAFCLARGKSVDAGKFVLAKYHLAMVERDEYPKQRRSLYAGFQIWLMNEKEFKNASKSSKQVGRNFISDR